MQVFAPEGCVPGQEIYTGVVVSKGGLPGHEGVEVLWKDPDHGGPPHSAWLPKQRVERKFWWENGGMPKVVRADTCILDKQLRPHFSQGGWELGGNAGMRTASPFSWSATGNAGYCQLCGTGK